MIRTGTTEMTESILYISKIVASIIIGVIVLGLLSFSIGQWGFDGTLCTVGFLLMLVAGSLINSSIKMRLILGFFGLSVFILGMSIFHPI